MKPLKYSKRQANYRWHVYLGGAAVTRWKRAGDGSAVRTIAICNQLSGRISLSYKIFSIVAYSAEPGCYLAESATRLDLGQKMP